MLQSDVQVGIFRDVRSSNQLDKRNKTRSVVVSMHLKGFSKSAMVNIINHYTRHHGDPNQTKYKYENQNIDPTRTHLNYRIGGVEDPVGLVEKCIEMSTTKPKKDTSVISNWVVTLPKNPQLEGREREFFDMAYRCLSSIVGGDNILGGYVHMDETTPHMHFAFVPLVRVQKMTNDLDNPLKWTAADEKKNPEHVAGTIKRDKKGTPRYKRVPVVDGNGDPVYNVSFAQTRMFDRNRMKTIHPEVEKIISRYFGFPVGIELPEERKEEKVLSSVPQDQIDIARAAVLDPIYEEEEKALERLEYVRRKLREAEEEERRLAIECYGLEVEAGEIGREVARVVEEGEHAGARVAMLEGFIAGCQRGIERLEDSIGGLVETLSNGTGAAHGFIDIIQARVHELMEVWGWPKPPDRVRQIGKNTASQKIMFGAPSAKRRI